MTEIKADTEELRKKYLARIRRVMSQVTARHADLYREIAENKDLFQKPRTQVIEGIRVGLSRGKGRLEVPNEEQTIAAIEEHLPKQAKFLIRIEKSLIVSAAKKLPPETLDLIGAEIVGKEDTVVIEEVEAQINKILSSLIKFQVEELSAEYEDAA